MLTLHKDDSRLDDVCAAAESACNGISGSHEWPVVVHPHFAVFKARGGSSVFGTTYALYLRDIDTIFVNSANFFALADDLKTAVLIHEVGHAYLHATKSQDTDCFAADIFACEHGQEDSIVKERSSLGDGYVDALALRGSPAAAREAFGVWFNQKRVGLI